MKKKLIIGVAIAVVALAFVFVLWRMRDARLPTVTLADGKQVIVQAVTYGTNHTVMHGSETFGKIQQHLPFTRRWLAPLFALRMASSEESLVLHFSVYDRAKSQYISLKLERFSVIDEHGCTFIRNHWGSSQGNARFSVASVRMPVFPRRQKSFTVRMNFAGYSPIDFAINNPLPPSTNEWTPEPLPATRQTNDLTVTLTKLIVRKEDSYAAPFQDIYENGTNSTKWYGVSRNFRDATGNASGTFLCLHERAWKLELDLHRRPYAPFPDSRILRIPNILFPESETAHPLTNHQFKVGNLSWQPIALCGPGYYVFSNDVCLSSAPWRVLTGLGSGLRLGQRRTGIFGSEKPFLLVRIEGARDLDQLLMRAQTQDGLKPFRFNGSEGNLKTFELDNPLPAGQPITLEFIPQQPIRVEFLVQPPRP